MTYNLAIMNRHNAHLKIHLEAKKSQARNEKFKIFYNM